MCACIGGWFLNLEFELYCRDFKAHLLRFCKLDFNSLKHLDLYLPTIHYKGWFSCFIVKHCLFVALSRLLNSEVIWLLTGTLGLSRGTPILSLALLVSVSRDLGKELAQLLRRFHFSPIPAESGRVHRTSQRPAKNTEQRKNCEKHIHPNNLLIS